MDDRLQKLHDTAAHILKRHKLLIDKMLSDDPDDLPHDPESMLETFLNTAWTEHHEIPIQELLAAVACTVLLRYRKTLS